MTTFAVTSTRSSPGATSLAVGLGFVWQKQGLEPLLVEADPAGGVLGLRFSLAAEPSLATLSADLRRGYESDRFVKNAVDLGGVRALLAPNDPLTASRVLERNADAFAEAFAAHRRPTVLDLGRLHPSSPALPLIRIADRVLLVARPVAEDVQSMLYGIRLLRSHDCQVSLVLVGDKPYHPAEVADLAGTHLAAVVPDDRVLASALSGGRYSARALRRSLLWRSITALADSLVRSYPHIETAQPPVPESHHRPEPLTPIGSVPSLSFEVAREQPSTIEPGLSSPVPPTPQPGPVKPPERPRPDTESEWLAPEDEAQ